MFGGKLWFGWLNTKIWANLFWILYEFITSNVRIVYWIWLNGRILHVQEVKKHLALTAALKNEGDCEDKLVPGIVQAQSRPGTGRIRGPTGSGFQTGVSPGLKNNQILGPGPVLGFTQRMAWNNVWEEIKYSEHIEFPLAVAYNMCKI